MFFAARSMHFEQFVATAYTNVIPLMTLVSAPRSISNCITSASPAAAACTNGVSSRDGPETFGSAPRSSSSFTTGAAPCRVVDTNSGVLSSLDRAFTSAPDSSSTRVFSKSVAAHIRAVALESLRLFGSAQRNAAAIQPVGIHLFRGTVTANTVLSQQRQNVTAEIDLTGSLSGKSPCK